MCEIDIPLVYNILCNGELEFTKIILNSSRYMHDTVDIQNSYMPIKYGIITEY